MNRMLAVIFILAQHSPQLYSQTNLIYKARSDVMSWASSLETYGVDYTSYPKGKSIKDIVKLIEPTYWEKVILIDPWGRPYQYSSDGSTFKISSFGPDRVASQDDIIAVSKETYALAQTGQSIESVNPILPVMEKCSQRPEDRIPFEKAVQTKNNMKKIVSSLEEYKNRYGGYPNVTGTELADLLNLKNYSCDGWNQKILYIPLPPCNKTSAHNTSACSQYCLRSLGGDSELDNPEFVYIVPDKLIIGDIVKIYGIGFSSIPRENNISFSGGEYVQAIESTFNSVTFQVPRGAVSGNIAVIVGGKATPDDVCSNIKYQNDEGEYFQDFYIKNSNFACFPQDFIKEQQDYE